MKHLFKQPLFYTTVLSLLALGLIIASYVFGWTTPTQSPPAGNVVLQSVTPGGSTGYVQFASSTQFAGDANLFWDNTNKRLGIGTTTPAYGLHIIGTMGTTATTTLAISGGNVGIGTTAPGGKLEVAGNIKISGTGNGINFPDGSVQTSAASGLVFKRMFITSTTYTGNLGGLSGADAACQARANAAGLGGTWKAILSSSTVNAKDRIGYNWDGIINLLGTVLYFNPRSSRPNITDISGFFSANPIIDVNYGITTEAKVYATGSSWTWTGTNIGGIVYSGTTCVDWTSNSTSYSGWGGSEGSNYSLYPVNWISGSVLNCNSSYQLYCIEQ
jgi:hypothetical protein